MKKVFAALLALCLLLSLAACGDPAATTGKQEPTTTAPNDAPATTTAPEAVPTTTVTPTTVPNVPETVDLVTAYENGTGSLLGVQFSGSYRMDFAYQSDFRGGTVTLTLLDEVVEGTFICDENYNIVYIEFLEEGAIIIFAITFDDAHRVLSAKSYVVEEENTDLRYEAEYGYDDQGRNVYTKRMTTGGTYYIAETEYSEAGQVLRQTSTNQYYMDDTLQSVTSITAYEYDENGCLSAMCMYDAQSQEQARYTTANTPEGECIRCTLEMDGAQMVMLMNGDGKAIQTEIYVAGELMNWIKNQLDDNGRVIRTEQWNAYQDATVVIEYAYTADGRRCAYTQTTNGEELVIERTTYQTVEIPE